MSRPRSHALRKGRFSEPQRIYHITTVTHDRAPLFRNATAARIVVNNLRILHAANLAATLAFVVMPDHLHWLMELQAGNTLPTVMRRLKGRSAFMMTRSHLALASVWQPGYHDHALRRDEDVVSTARYIIANPLRAGLVATLADYPWWDAVWL